MIDVPVVWIAPADGAPSASAEALLARFAQARGFHIVSPTDDATKAIALDPKVTSDVEASLLAGRDALARLDTDAIERAAAHTLTVLHAHPELPQAAWLAAEAHRLLASRFKRAEPRDPARADREWREANALDGGRAAGLGEPEGAPASEAVELAVPSVAGVEIAIDGVTVGPTVKLAFGEHHALFHRGGRVVGGSWFGVADATPLRFAPPTPPACSREELGGATVGEGGTASALGARCPTWVVAESGIDVVRVAVCNGATCGAFLELRTTAIAKPPPPPPRPFPIWIPIVGASAVAVVATGLILWAAGAFDARATVVSFTQGNVEPASHLP